MDKEAFKELLNGIDFAALIPDINDILGIVAPAARVLMVVSPFVLLAYGLYCLLISPKEATYLAGYRFRWGMASVQSWRFMQRFAGVVFMVLGLGMAIFMALETANLGEMALMDLLMLAAGYIIFQAVVTLLGCLLINLAVLIRYDRKGVRRYTWWELIRG